MSIPITEERSRQALANLCKVAALSLFLILAVCGSAHADPPDALLGPLPCFGLQGTDAQNALSLRPDQITRINNVDAALFTDLEAVRDSIHLGILASGRIKRSAENKVVSRVLSADQQSLAILTPQQLKVYLRTAYGYSGSLAAFNPTFLPVSNQSPVGKIREQFIISILKATGDEIQQNQICTSVKPQVDQTLTAEQKEKLKEEALGQ